MLAKDKINMLIDGQFGSCGKGHVAEFIAKEEKRIDFSLYRSSPNAGHSFYDEKEDEKFVSRVFPVSGILNKDSIIYLSPESAIDPELFFEEKEKFSIRDDRIFIHPRAGIIDKEAKICEKNIVENISSTGSGTGTSRAMKIMREKTVSSIESLKPFCKALDLNSMLKEKKNRVFFAETTQGVGLGLNYGFSYPYCTSCDFLPSSIMSSFGVHPSFLGEVSAVFRTFPIRVGYSNIGCTSGPFYPDSHEISFESISVKPEYTTCTKKMRRIATFSLEQYREVCDSIMPDNVFLTFADYLSSRDLVKLLTEMEKIHKVDYISFSDKCSDVFYIKNS